jgi:hypothetical protein
MGSFSFRRSGVNEWIGSMRRRPWQNCGEKWVKMKGPPFASLSADIPFFVMTLTGTPSPPTGDVGLLGKWCSNERLADGWLVYDMQYALHQRDE